MASTTLPPWVRPLEVEDRFLMDGGVVSNLPIEPALSQGATEIIALDVAEPLAVDPGTEGFGPFLTKLTATVEQRQIDLELALAEARGVPVYRIVLRVDPSIALWDFSHADVLIPHGYEITRQQIADWQPGRRTTEHRWLARLRLRKGT